MYLNTTEVESALVALAASYPSICTLITLPSQSIEGRTSHALRLGTQPAGSVPAFYLTGGVHAREWGSADILVNLATDLCAAYTANASLTYGNRRYSAAEVRALRVGDRPEVTVGQIRVELPLQSVVGIVGPVIGWITSY